MNASMFEHFGVITEKKSDLYHHNIGLKPMARYKTGFATVEDRKVKVYKNDGTTYPELIPTFSTILDITPVPSIGLIVVMNYSSGTNGGYYLESFDVKSGEKLGSIKFPLSQLSYDVLENGDIAVLRNRDLFLYSKEGQLKSSIPYAVNGDSTVSKVVALSSKKSIFLGDGNSMKGKVLNSNDLSLKIDNVPFSAYFIGFAKDGSILYSNNYSYSVVNKTKIDYVNNAILSTTSVPVTTKDTVIHLRNIGNKVYFLSEWYANTGPADLVEVNLDNGVQTTLVNLHAIKDLDDKFIYAANGNFYNIYSKEDFSLVYSIPSNFDFIRSTKGKYENFGKYW